MPDKLGDGGPGGDVSRRAGELMRDYLQHASPFNCDTTNRGEREYIAYDDRFECDNWLDCGGARSGGAGGAVVPLG